MASEHFDLPDLITRVERLSSLWRQAADWAAHGIPSWLEADIQQLEQSLRAPLQALIGFVGSLPDDSTIAALLHRLTEDANTDKDKKREEAEKSGAISPPVAQQTADTYARLAELLKPLGFTPSSAAELEEVPPLDDFITTPAPAAQPPQPQPPAPKPGSAADRPRAPEPQFGGKITPAPIGRGSADVHFSAYYPPRISVAERYALIVYAHLAELLSTIEADAQKFAQELGGSVPPRTSAQQSARLATNTPITVTPECSGLTFDPPSLTKTWDGSWTRFNFDLKSKAEAQGKTLIGRLAICVALIEIAHIDFSIEVEAAQPAIAVGTNSLAAAKLANSTTKLYQKIFVSYSRRDREIVDSYRVAQTALGNDVFVDTESIRSGQNWQAALATAIDNADIFQLFWSTNSAASSNVRDEWDYALHYRCPQTQCADFLRPVYWQNPLTPPPAELNHLNFKYVPVQVSDSNGFWQRLRKLFGSG